MWALCRMNFLSNILREEGGFEYKKAIVDSIVILIRDIPDAKESGLLHLCEFIEDCEFTYLSTQVDFYFSISIPSTELFFGASRFGVCFYLDLCCFVVFPRYFTFLEMRDPRPQIPASISVIFTIE